MLVLLIAFGFGRVLVIVVAFDGVVVVVFLHSFGYTALVLHAALAKVTSATGN